MTETGSPAIKGEPQIDEKIDEKDGKSVVFPSFLVSSRKSIN
ncbi:hypothetical protein [Mangrovibacter sp. MFB070]|nr:hypothetical protein [Mangrovibacter sp. MFB070]